MNTLPVVYAPPPHQQRLSKTVIVTMVLLASVLSTGFGLGAQWVAQGKNNEFGHERLWMAIGARAKDDTARKRQIEEIHVLMDSSLRIQAKDHELLASVVRVECLNAQLPKTLLQAANIHCDRLGVYHLKRSR